MNGLLAKPVFEVLKHGFWIYELVQKGEDISFQLERTILADMVKAIPDPVYEKQNSSIYTKQINLKNENDRRERNQASNGFMGARYPIVCFLDELFTSSGSKWANYWNEQKMEVDFYNSNDRAWRFWDQAKISEQLPNLDLLEIFFLCTYLGFQGVYADQKNILEAWQKKTAQRLNAKKSMENIQWETGIITNVPPRNSFLAFRQMLIVVGITVSIIIPILVFITIFKITH